MPPLPVTLIAGYLGAGKTTLVNHTLRQAGGRKLMVMVNDFGDLPIDAGLIESKDGSTITLSNGCICCSMNGDLAGAFMDVLDLEDRPDHLLIETSGVAEPKRIADLARAEPDLALNGTVVLVDGANIQQQASDPLVGSTVRNQLEAADMHVLNKTDLLSEVEQLALVRWLDTQFPQVSLVTCEHAQLPIDILLGIEEAHASQTLSRAHNHEDHYIRWSLEAQDT